MKSVHRKIIGEAGAVALAIAAVMAALPAEATDAGQGNSDGQSTQSARPGRLPLRREWAMPFASTSSSILNWQADGEQGIWVQGIGRQWYYGKFLGPCIGLTFANTIGFRPNPTGTFDKFSSIELVDGTRQRCQLVSFTTSEGPPKAAARKAAAANAAGQGSSKKGVTAEADSTQAGDIHLE